MPRSLKIPAKSIKTRKYSPRSVLKCPETVVSVCNAFKFPETEYPKASSIYLKPCCTKYKATETLNNKSNAMCKCVKSSKIIDSIKRDKKKQTNTTTGLVESTKSAPLPYYCCNGRFPEVEYPMNIVETWSPKYWTQLPNTQIKKCSTTICNQDTEDIIKATHTAIEKAVHDLLRLQQRSSLPADTCPLNEQAVTQFFTSDQGNVTLITNATTIRAVPQTSDIQDCEQNTPSNKKANSKSNGQDLAITDDLPDKTIIPSSGGSDIKNESDLPVIATDPSWKLIFSGESILSNVSSNEAPVGPDSPKGTDPSSTKALSCPVIPSDNVESVSMAKDSLSTIDSIENISDSPTSPAVPDLDYSAVGADATIPKITSTSPKSTIPDTSDSFDEPTILNKDNAPLDTTTTNTDDFLAISNADINTASNNICIPNATEDCARKSSSLSDSSDDVQPNMMEIQEYDYTTVSPFYNDLEVDSFKNVPNKETWILDPNDKEYIIVGKLS